MKLVRLFALIGVSCSLLSCFLFKKEEKPVESPVKTVVVQKLAPTPASEAGTKDKTLNVFARYFEQADAIHREAWWVLTSERYSTGRSPFGKVQRALLASQNIKLPNKSLFRCDRYLVKRDVMGVKGFPQSAEIFEKCSEKSEARKIAYYTSENEKEIKVTFYPEHLEEILGLGATVLNKTIQCTIRGNENAVIVSLICKDWSQDRSKEHMIRLDTYDYEKEGRNMIKLRGKVYENLSDIRKIEADVPMEGKIEVKETELYPPPVAPAPVATATPSPKPSRPANAPPMSLPAQGGAVPVAPQGALPPPRGGEEQHPVDPDVMLQRQMENQGWPTGEAPLEQAPVPGETGSAESGEIQPQEPVQVLPLQMQYQNQLLQQQQQQIEQQQPAPQPEGPAAGGVPNGR